MAFAGARLPNFCLNRVIGHIRVRSSPICTKPVCTPFKANGDQKNELFHSSDDKDQKISGCGEDANPENQIGKRIMIVVDSSPEAKGALQWALSHAASEQDTIILLYVSKSSVQGKDSDQTNPRIYEMLSSMRCFCHNKRPGVYIEIEVSFVIGNQKDKGAMIVEEAKKQGASLLVLGHKKRSMRWQLLMIWAVARFGSATTGGGGGVVEHCIQNAHCMTIAVRRKSRRFGGYLITTKRHNDFWLLA
ncbi:hypothetical protein Scep_022065 [Stephania cephalantha]|uniref:UspA domain-containing protein n=1 Tax=Stephania cephalantha TaxID=152367 RepID=A0AAP0F5N8_9MAGN